MAMSKTKLQVVRTMCVLGVILGLTACSAKAPAVGTLKGKTKADQDAEGTKTPKPPKDKEEVLGGDNDNGPDPAIIDDVASNQPVKDPVNPTKPEEETITPPAPITGDPNDPIKNDPSRTVKDGFYFIKAAGSLKCLSVPNNSKDNGVQLEQRACDSKSDAQKFELEFLPSEKAYSIVNRANHKVLEVRDQMEVPQNAIQQSDYHGLSYQMFNFEVQDGKYKIKTKTKGLYMNVTGASQDNGALIQLWHEGNVTSSTWILEPTL